MKFNKNASVYFLVSGNKHVYTLCFRKHNVFESGVMITKSFYPITSLG